MCNEKSIQDLNVLQTYFSFKYCLVKWKKNIFYILLFLPVIESIIQIWIKTYENALLFYITL